MMNLFISKFSKQFSRCLHTSSRIHYYTREMKNNLNFQTLNSLDHEQLVYRVVELQRRLDSYQMLYDPKNFNGKDKVRVPVPDVSDIIRKRTNLRKIALKFVYTGWNYQSYPFEISHKKKSNVKNIETNSVERVFLEALLRQQLIISLNGGHYMERAGRTDKSVNSSAQVISLIVRSNLDQGYGILKNTNRRQSYYEEHEHEDGTQEDKYRIDDTSLDEDEINYMQLLNEALPEDIRVIAWSPVHSSFSARFDCSAREYKYLFREGKYDIDLMNKQAEKFTGENDYRNFCKKNDENSQKGNMIRTMYKCSVDRMEIDEINKEFNLCVATIKARGFLLNQIRKMMSVLFAVGSGNEDCDVIDRMLDVDNCTRSPAYKLCVPEKLIMSNTYYREEDVCWRYDHQSLQDSIRIIAQRYDDYATRADVLKYMYQKILRQDSTIEQDTEQVDSTLQQSGALEQAGALQQSGALQEAGALGLSTSVFPEKRFSQPWLDFERESARTLEEASQNAKKRQLRRDLGKGNYRTTIEKYEKEENPSSTSTEAITDSDDIDASFPAQPSSIVDTSFPASFSTSDIKSDNSKQ